jgi:hypothetical protein
MAPQARFIVLTVEEEKHTEAEGGTDHGCLALDEAKRGRFLYAETR